MSQSPLFKQENKCLTCRRTDCKERDKDIVLCSDYGRLFIKEEAPKKEEEAVIV